ncbi:SKN1 [Candida oxycetoniae]|uniref:SKN1 n=1 Tax=Candida oxycetoniae TaxID=497107 RepID=A0AAI9T1C7_9ASCO|nr:SKN1 [Candida oxycetoniae]KAI3406240.2 SKN1 [Candida oxycetoniae]
MRRDLTPNIPSINFTSSERDESVSFNDVDQDQDQGYAVSNPFDDQPDTISESSRGGQLSNQSSDISHPHHPHHHQPHLQRFNYPPSYDSQSVNSVNSPTTNTQSPPSPHHYNHNHNHNQFETNASSSPQTSKIRTSLFINSSQSMPSTSSMSPYDDRYPKQAIFDYANYSNQTSTVNLLVDSNKNNNNNNNNNNNSFQHHNMHSHRDSSSSSSIQYNYSSPPVTGSYDEYEYEFSPFGGYPASQFPLSIDEKEPDDYLHNPDPVLDSEYNEHRFYYDLKNMDRKSIGGLLGFVVMSIIVVGIFVLLPVLTFTNSSAKTRVETYEVLTHYSYPMLSAIRQSLVDPDTPEEAMTNVGQDGRVWKLVFSDEFNAEGRTFYDGDDQFFTAPDLHYAATQDLEWYDPDAVTTKNGTLELTLDAFQNHNLFYRSGMIQSWNKMCFTQGRIEISAKLPNYGNVTGLWPGLWTMGNLGRPGYLASTEGVWPYTYDSCDAGITPNQSSPDGISYLPGQRLNKCTCPGESHPNPGVGRGAPEIDALEGEIHGVIGRVSQSLQIAPYDIWYMPDYDFIEVHNASVTLMNTYAGGPFQQAVSGVTMLNTTWYEFGEGKRNFQKYGYEYLNDDNTGYITWFVGDDPTFTMHAHALHPNGNVGWRQIPKEPISIVMNLGISNSWAYIDWPSLVFPSRMRVDYVRVYQPEDAVNVGCDPKDYPTYDYIQQHLNIYQNMNLTNFAMGGYTFPKNKLTGC